MKIRLTTGEYDFIPTWNNNDTADAKDQIIVRIKKPTTLEWDSIMGKSFTEKGVSLKIDKPLLVKQIISIKNLFIEQDRRTIEITTGNQLLQYGSLYYLVDEIGAEILQLDSIKK